MRRGGKLSAARCPRRGGRGGGRLPPLPFRHPRGGLPFSSPAYPAFTFFSAPLSPHPPSPVGKGETKVIFMQGASPLASPGDGRDAALKVGGMRRPAGACPGRHGQVNSGSPNPAEAAKPILQHPTSQPPCKSASDGWNRARTSAPTNNNPFEKSSGGCGGLFQESPSASPHPRILASPFPITPVRHGDDGRGCRSRRSGRRLGGGRRRRRTRGQRRGGRGTGRSRPCRRE